MTEYKELAARLRALADERDRDPTADIREAASAIEALEAERDEAAWNALDTFSREYHEAYHCDPVAMANGRNNWRKAAEAAEAAEARCKRLEEALSDAHESVTAIDTWAKAYPLSVFPEPDFDEVRKLLAAGNITVDAVSASNMRHVLNGVQGLVTEALRRLELSN